MISVRNLYVVFIFSEIIAGSFLMYHDSILQHIGESRAYGTGCELSLNVSKDVFREGDSVIIYGESPYNTQLVAGILPVGDEHTFTKASVFASQGCHYTHVLGRFSSNETGYYWIAITEADMNGIEQGNPEHVATVFYEGNT
jgi:hypothetical protein